MPVSCLLSGLPLVSGCLACGGVRGRVARWLRGPLCSPRNAATLLGSPTSSARGGLVGTCPGRAACWARPEHGVGEDLGPPGLRSGVGGWEGTSPRVTYSASGFLVGARETVIFGVFVLSLSLVGLARSAFCRKRFPACFLFKNCLRSCLTCNSVKDGHRGHSEFTSDQMLNPVRQKTPRAGVLRSNLPDFCS